MIRSLGRRDVAIALALLLLWTLAGCRGPASAGPALITRAHAVMGTEVRVTVWTSDEAAAESAMAAVFAEFDRLDALLSVWKPVSDVVRINAAAGGPPVPVLCDGRAARPDAQHVRRLRALLHPGWRALSPSVGSIDGSARAWLSERQHRRADRDPG